jgi:hypothetical protein
MQDKQKVTLYLPPDLHRKMKIRAAVDGGAMSDFAQRAIEFYLAHPEVVDQDQNGSSFGKTHQVHSCPECDASVVVRDGDLVSLRQQPGAVIEEEVPVVSCSDESLLVTC